MLRVEALDFLHGHLQLQGEVAKMVAQAVGIGDALQRCQLLEQRVRRALLGLQTFEGGRYICTTLELVPCRERRNIGERTCKALLHKFETRLQLLDVHLRVLGNGC